MQDEIEFFKKDNPEFFYIRFFKDVGSILNIKHLFHDYTIISLIP